MIEYDAVLVVDGFLSEAMLVGGPLKGTIFKDKKCRFTDNTYVKTSALERINYTPTGVYAQTANTVYKVVLI